MIAQTRPAELAAWMHKHAESGPPLVLDVREPWEIQTASVKPNGFDLVCIPMGVLPARLHELNPQRPIACLCHHGGRSMQVALFLASRGFAHVANIAGGIAAWSDELDRSVPRY